jgi:uncharacterized protein YukE
MSDLIQSGFDYAVLPVDVALKAQLAANSIKLRLKRTVEDIIEIGRELTAVKAELPHWQSLPWIAAEFEMTKDTAQNFMSVFDRFGKNGNFPFLNLKPSILYALSAPSTPETVVDKAIEKAEAGEKVTVADVKDWKAELDAEKKAREEAEKRSKEWNEQYIKERDAKRAAEQKVLTLESQVKPKPEVVEKTIIPSDYESTKRQAAELKAQTEALQKQLADLKNQQTQLVNNQVKTKLQGYQSELDKLEADKRAIEEVVERKKAYLSSLDNEVKRIETHQDVINGVRLELISLAAFLNDMEPINDRTTILKWLALADMHEEAMKAIRMVFGEKSLESA